MPRIILSPPLGFKRNVAHVVATFGMLLQQRLFHVHENDIRPDRAVVTEGGFSIAPGTVALDILA
jgi:hypothetical protein